MTLDERAAKVMGWDVRDDGWIYSNDVPCGPYPVELPYRWKDD